MLRRAQQPLGPRPDDRLPTGAADGARSRPTRTPAWPATWWSGPPSGPGGPARSWPC